jgi:S1-C subfamily serine protease
LLREQLNQQKKVLRLMRVLMGVGLLPWVGVGLLLWHEKPEAPPPVVVTYCPQAEETGPQDDVLPVVDAQEVAHSVENDPVRAIATARASLLRVLGDKTMKVVHVSLSGREFLRAMQGVDTRTRVLPVELAGGKAGLKLVRLPSGGYWDLMGMRSGDVLVALNGYGMRDPRTAMQAHVEMMRAQHGVFELERDGERYALSVRWDD